MSGIIAPISRRQFQYKQLRGLRPHQTVRMVNKDKKRETTN